MTATTIIDAIRKIADELTEEFLKDRNPLDRHDVAVILLRIARRAEYLQVSRDEVSQ